MEVNLLGFRQAEECQVHGGHSRKANKALLVMILVSFSLIIWHVWTYGPSGHLARFENSSNSFPLLVGNEIWDLLFNKRGIIAELREVFPYFIVGVMLAGYLRTFKVAVKLQASLRKYGAMSVVVASFVGIITPLCACGTLTTAISLLFAGLPLAPVMSLMITSSLLSPSTYLITLNDLGPEWTVIRTIAALSLGIFAGFLTHLLRTRGFETKTLFVEGAVIRGDFHDEDYPDERLRCNCKQKFGNRVAVRTNNKFLIFLAKSTEMLWMVGKYILVGVAMGAIVERYMPTDWIFRFFGQKDPLNIVWVTMVSVPMFLHQLSASSIISHIKGALDGTLDGGAALAFMVGGPVTAIPTMVLFWSIFKKRVFFLYMFVCLAGTIMISYAFQLLVFEPGVDTGNELLRGVSSLSGGRSAVIAKQDKNVRMVMDPGGNGLIATYLNTLDGKGGVVFDSGYDRLIGETSARHDNATYASNIARWLEQNSNSTNGTNILVYDLSPGKSGVLYPKTISHLINSGFTVNFAGRGTRPQLTDKILAGYGQLWLIFDSATRLSAPELQSVLKFAEDGKGILLVARANPGAATDLSGANQLASRYGVTFSGAVDNREEISAGIASRMFGEAAVFLGRFLKLAHKA